MRAFFTHSRSFSIFHVNLPLLLQLVTIIASLVMKPIPQDELWMKLKLRRLVESRSKLCTELSLLLATLKYIFVLTLFYMYKLC